MNVVILVFVILLNLYQLQKLRKLIIMIINQPSFYHLREIVREAETSRKRPGFYNTLCTYKFPKLAHFNFRYILNSCRINIDFDQKLLLHPYLAMDIWWTTVYHRGLQRGTLFLVAL